jgi:hypothetical protein
MRIGALIPALAFVAACGGGSKPAPQEPTPPIAEEAKVDPALLRDIAAGLEDVLTTMASITEGADNCPAMATQLTQLFEKSTELFDLAKAQSADPEASAMLTAEMDQRAAAVEPLVERIGRGLARCKMDPDVAGAMERMPTF